MSFKIYLEEGRFIEFTNEESILECLEKQGITCDYSCRGGFCGVCITQKQFGEVYYNQEPLYLISNDEILTCCCLPNSDIKLNLNHGLLS